MDLKETLRGIVREEFDKLFTELSGDGPSRRTRISTTANGADARVERTDNRTGPKGPRVSYHLTKAGQKKGAADSLKGNFKIVFKSIAKAQGRSKRDYMDRTELTLKSTESAIYALQQMGLIESRPTGE